MSPLFQKRSLGVRSLAKINLSLSVVGRRDDGYHLLEMVNLPLDLHDVIEVSVTPRAETTHIVTDDPVLNAVQNNLCAKAIDKMRETFRFRENFHVHIHKEIPFAAGLGGGSSNAASVMLAVRALLRLPATDEELNRIGTAIGADVPYFFVNKPALLSGIGERIRPIRVAKEYWCLLVKPDQGISTKECFAIFDGSPCRPNSMQEVVDALANGDDERIAQSIGNDLEEPAIRLAPAVKDVLAALRASGLKIVGMSGAGSCCFALTDNAKQAKAAYRALSVSKYWVLLTKTLR